jgi:hypothetical protein
MLRNRMLLLADSSKIIAPSQRWPRVSALDATLLDRDVATKPEVCVGGFESHPPKNGGVKDLFGAKALREGQRRSTVSNSDLVRFTASSGAPNWPKRARCGPRTELVEPGEIGVPVVGQFP